MEQEKFTAPTRIARQWWWKLLGAALVLYSLIVGLAVPLNVGITDLSRISAKAGETFETTITGYNSHYQTAQQNRVWLKLDNDHLIAGKIESIDSESSLLASFSLPGKLPNTEQAAIRASIILDNEIDGATSVPEAVSIAANPDSSAWSKSVTYTPLSDIHQKRPFVFPFRNIIEESIRNTYYHVPLWFAMLFVLLASVVYNIQYLRSGGSENDHKATAAITAGILMGVLGLATGAVWARYTWGAFWSNDIKQIGTAVALLIYLAYYVLRASFEDREQAARVSAVYSIFAFVAWLLLIYAVPRMMDSLHPGSGGNPAFGADDLDNRMRLIFYPAIIGWTCLAFWLASLLYRMNRIKDKIDSI